VNAPSIAQTCDEPGLLTKVVGAVRTGMGGENTRQAGFYAAARQPKAIWKVPGAEHTAGIDAQPAEYEQRVTAFFAGALLEAK